MDKGLKLNFALDKHESIYGESILFNAVLSHVFTSPINVKTRKPTNRSLVITIKGAGGYEQKADQMSCPERDGIYTKPPRTPDRTSLDPGGELTLTGDLLSWFGTIPPGLYKVSAEYKGIFRVVFSKTIEIRIHPAMINTASLPRWGLQTNATPFSGAWVHKQN